MSNQIQDLNNVVENTGEVYPVQDLTRATEETSPEFERNSEVLQREAFGGHYFDDVTARKRATAYLYQVQEDNLINMTRAAIEDGARAEDIKEMLAQVNAKQVPDEVSLEVMSAEEMSRKNQELADNIFANDKDIDFKEQLKNVSANSKILQTKLAEADTDYEDLSLWNKFSEFGRELIPLMNATETAWAMDSTKHIVKPSQARLYQQQAVQQAARTLPPEQFKVYCDIVSKSLKDRGLSKTAIKSFWEDMQTVNTNANDFFMVADMMDVGAVGDFLFKGSRAAEKGTMMSAKRARELLAKKKVSKIDDLADDAAKLTEKETEELVEATTPTALKPNGELSNAAELNNEVARQAIDEETVKQFNDLVVVRDEGISASTENDLEIFKKGVVDQFNFGSDELAQYDITMIGDRTVNIKCGHGANRNSPFATKEAAETFAKKHAIEGQWSVEALPEGYYVNIQTPLPQIATSFKDLKKDESWKQWYTNPFGRWFSTLKKSEQAHKYEVVTTRAQDAARKIAQNLTEIVTRLNKEETKRLDMVLQQSIAETKWFSDETLRNTFNLSEKEIEAYHAIKKANDLEYVTTNAIFRHNLDIQGYKIINKNGEKFVGKHVSPDTINFADTAFFDATSNNYIGPGSMTKKELLKVLGDDKVLLKRRSAGRFDEDLPYKYVIADRNSVKIEELPQYILKYLPGPRIYYAEGTLFAKQARTKSVLSHELIIHPRTLKAGLNKKQMNQYADEMNEVLAEYRKVANKSITKEEFTETVNEMTAKNDYIRVASYDDFKDNYLKKYHMDYKNDIEIVEDGEVLKGDQMARQRGAGYFDDPEEYQSSTLQDMYDDNADMFYSRGERLTTPDGDVAPLVSPRRMMEKTLNRMIYEKTAGNYNKWAANEFKRMFYDVINFNPDHPYMSAKEFLESVTINNNQQNLMGRNKAKAAEHFLRNWRNLSVQTTPWDRRINNYMKGLADFLGDKGLFLKRGSEAYEKLTKARPDQFFRSAIFQLKLGCFNPRQLWLQASGALQLSLLEPTLAAKTMAMYGPLRAAMISEDAGVIKRLAIAAGKLATGGAKNFENRVKVLKKLNAYGADQLSAYAPGRSVMSPKSWKESSTMFFREGERFNFLSANNIAIDSYLAKHPDMTMEGLLKNDEALMDIMSYSDHLYLNMSRASQMGSQAGVGSMFMQFARYPFAFIEALTNKQFTSSQKVRLLLGDLAMFGVAGTAGVSGYEFLTDTVGMSLENAEMMNKGLLTTAFNEAGIPIDLSEAGPQFLQKFNQLITAEGAIDIAASIPASEVFVSGMDIGKLMKKIAFEYLPAHDDVNFVKEAQWMSTSHLPSTLKNVTRAIIIDKVGKLYSRNGNVLVDKLGPEEAIYKALGFRLSSEYQLEELLNANANFDKTAKDLSEDVIKALKVWQANPNDEVAYRDYQSIATLVLGSLQDDPAMYKAVNDNIVKEVKDSGMSLRDRSLQRLARQQGYEKYFETKDERKFNTTRENQ